MTPVDQTVIHAETGDCARAVTASLLDLPLDAVPNFNLHGEAWFHVYWYFLYALGYEYKGRAKLPQPLFREESINGFFHAGVPSKTFPGKLHAVVINMAGEVVHDPNPNKLWQGVNVLLSGDLIDWDVIVKREAQQ